MKDLGAMTSLGKLFMNGRSQAIRLPKAFRFPGDKVRITKVEGGILVQPVVDDFDLWFAELKRLSAVSKFDIERDQPPMPTDKDLFD